MRVLSMHPADITYICEFRLTDLVKLRNAMNLVQVNYDSTKPEEVEQARYLTGPFMEFLDFAIKGAEDAA